MNIYIFLLSIRLLIMDLFRLEVKFLLLFKLFKLNIFMEEFESLIYIMGGLPRELSDFLAICSLTKKGDEKLL